MDEDSQISDVTPTESTTNETVREPNEAVENIGGFKIEPKIVHILCICRLSCGNV